MTYRKVIRGTVQMRPKHGEKLCSDYMDSGERGTVRNKNNARYNLCCLVALYPIYELRLNQCFHIRSRSVVKPENP
ncbi:hypothetical protein YC2023_050512 [Brassica napus]